MTLLCAWTSSVALGCHPLQRHVMTDQTVRQRSAGGPVVEPDALAEPQNSKAGKGNSR